MEVDYVILCRAIDSEEIIRLSGGELRLIMEMLESTYNLIRMLVLRSRG